MTDLDGNFVTNIDSIGRRQVAGGRKACRR